MPALRGLRARAPPHGSGPAEDAPIVLKDKALKDAVILRLLAAERLASAGCCSSLLAYGIYRFDGAKDSLQQVFAEYLPRLQPFAERAGIDLQNAGPVKMIEEALNAQHSTP